MSWKAYALVSVVGVAATYVASAPPSFDATPRAAAPAPAAAVAAPARDLQQQAARLQARVEPRADYAEPRADYAEPSRNPFRFGAVTAAPAPTTDAALEPGGPPPPPPPAAPVIQLVGIARRTVAGAPMRSAVLVTDQGVLEVREGDAVGARYRVTLIDEGAIELVTPDGARRRIELRP